MQQKIQAMQDKFGRLLVLQQQLEESLKDWREAATLRDELNEFYQQPEWIDLYENADTYQIETHDNYSVLSQDGIWNALADHVELTKAMAEIIQPTLDRLALCE